MKHRNARPLSGNNNQYRVLWHIVEEEERKRKRKPLFKETQIEHEIRKYLNEGCGDVDTRRYDSLKAAIMYDEIANCNHT